MALQLHLSKSNFWYRWRDRGWLLTRSPMLFSERNGYMEFRQLPFGWRLRRLKPLSAVPIIEEREAEALFDKYYYMVRSKPQVKPLEPIPERFFDESAN
jgi:hypothetical protein